MKVVAFNGSPKAEGNTYQAISMVTEELKREDIEVEIIHVGNKSLRGCLACGYCRKNKNERCVMDDELNGWIQKMKAADGIIIGSPVYFSSMAGSMMCFLDRAFYVASGNNGLFRHKVGAAVVAVRRSGGVTTFNQLNNYMIFAEMLIPGSNYWNVGYGLDPGEIQQDEEGKQIMRILGKNMAWLMKLVENGKGRIPEPEAEAKTRMSFIR